MLRCNGKTLVLGSARLHNRAEVWYPADLIPTILPWTFINVIVEVSVLLNFTFTKPPVTIHVLNMISSWLIKNSKWTWLFEWTSELNSLDYFKNAYRLSTSIKHVFRIVLKNKCFVLGSKHVRVENWTQTSNHSTVPKIVIYTIVKSGLSSKPVWFGHQHDKDLLSFVLVLLIYE